MSESAATSREYDIAIVGGGLVGASMALALARFAPQLRVAVLEAFALPTLDQAPVYRANFDARSMALSYSSRLIFEALGTWRRLQPYTTAIQTVHVSDRGHIGQVRLTAEEQGLDAVGYVIENHWLGPVLLDEVTTCQQVDWLSPARVEGIRIVKGGTRLDVQQGDERLELHARLAVIADGAGSSARQQLGIEALTTHYDQVALIANVGFERSHEGVAFERFTARGPLAMLPLDERADDARNSNRAALVWTLPPDDAERLLEAPEAVFLDELQQQFGFRLGRLTRVGQRDTYPLTLVQSREQVRQRVVVVGNAAHSLHPVAGQGFNLALRDVWQLVQQIVSAEQRGADFSSLDELQAYLASQTWDQQKTIAFSDWLPKLFSNDNLALAAGRNLGLVGLSLMDGARKLLGQQAMGMNGTGIYRA